MNPDLKKIIWIIKMIIFNRINLALLKLNRNKKYYLLGAKI